MQPSTPAHDTLAQHYTTAVDALCEIARAYYTGGQLADAQHLLRTSLYIERLNATFRSALACLVRRGRAIAHTETLLNAGMWLVGSCYNFCWYHDSLRERAPKGAPLKWDERTPAMAANLTDHRWTMRELLTYQVPPRPKSLDTHTQRPAEQTPLRKAA